MKEYKIKFPDAILISDELRHACGKKFRENNPMKTQEMKNYMSKIHADKIISEETRQKLSIAHTGKINVDVQQK